MPRTAPPILRPRLEKTGRKPHAIRRIWVPRSCADTGPYRNAVRNNRHPEAGSSPRHRRPRHANRGDSPWVPPRQVVLPCRETRREPPKTSKTIAHCGQDFDYCLRCGAPPGTTSSPEKVVPHGRCARLGGRVEPPRAPGTAAPRVEKLPVSNRPRKFALNWLSLQSRSTEGRQAVEHLPDSEKTAICPSPIDSEVCIDHEKPNRQRPVRSRDLACSVLYSLATCPFRRPRHCYGLLGPGP